MISSEKSVCEDKKSLENTAPLDELRADRSQLNGGTNDEFKTCAAASTGANPNATTYHALNRATVADVRSTTTTETLSGTATVVSPADTAGASNYLGQGWSLSGLERVISETGGVILDLGAGDSLWFAASGSGGYSSPAGDFSTLAGVSGGGWTRTMTDGTVYTFNSSGQETAVADRDQRTTSYTYSSDELTKITDPYGKVTTLTYVSSVLQSVENPAAPSPPSRTRAGRSPPWNSPIRAR